MGWLSNISEWFRKVKAKEQETGDDDANFREEFISQLAPEDAEAFRSLPREQQDQAIAQARQQAEGGQA